MGNCLALAIIEILVCKFAKQYNSSNNVLFQGKMRAYEQFSNQKYLN